MKERTTNPNLCRTIANVGGTSVVHVAVQNPGQHPSLRRELRLRLIAAVTGTGPRQGLRRTHPRRFLLIVFSDPLFSSFSRSLPLCFHSYVQLKNRFRSRFLSFSCFSNLAWFCLTGSSKE